MDIFRDPSDLLPPLPPKPAKSCDTASISPPSLPPKPPIAKATSSIIARSLSVPLANSHDTSPDMEITEPKRSFKPTRPIVHVKKPSSSAVTRAMTLYELDQQYSSSLPLVIMSISGYYGRNSDIQLSNLEMIYVHLRKTTDVVTVLGDSRLSIPINSGYRFSLIQQSEAYFYNGVKKLAKATPVPKVVSCMKAWSKGSTVLEENELLVLKGYEGDKKLQAFSISSNTTKTLPFACNVQFTTDPNLVPMYLSDIIAHVPDPFPCKVLIHASEEVVALIGTRYITLAKNISETTLLCSSPSTNATFELPVDLPDVLVSVVETVNETEQVQLYQSHVEITSNYNPAYSATVCRNDCTKKNVSFANRDAKIC